MPFHVTCVCGHQMVIGDDRAGEVVRCAACQRDVAIPTLEAPPPPPPQPPPPPAPAVPPTVKEPPAIIVDTEVPVRIRTDPELARRNIRRISVALGWLALLSSTPVVLEQLQPREALTPRFEPWAMGIVLLAVLLLAYALYLFQLPDWSSARVVSVLTLIVAALYAVMAGITWWAAPGHRLTTLLALEANLFSPRQEALWCALMSGSLGLLSYLAAQVARRT